MLSVKDDRIATWGELAIGFLFFRSIHKDKTERFKALFFFQAGC